MRIYAAPLEGVTGWQFRATHAKYFGGVDRYYTPFLTPGRGSQQPGGKALRDLMPERNDLERTVPQLLTRNAEDFLWGAETMAAFGYREVNLNLGCPSGTVVAKGRGSGFLRDPEELDAFFDTIFPRSPLPVSVKTRLGLTDSEEFPRLLEVFRRYPIRELTVHPRVRKDFYSGQVRLDSFAPALEDHPWPVCYNGDLVTVGDVQAIQARFPEVEAVMLGRGLMADPALARKLRGGPAADRETLRKFHDDLFACYTDSFDSAANAMMRMKELWGWLIHLFGDHQKLAKALRKARTPEDFSLAAAAVFRDLPLLEEAVGPL